MIKYFTGILEKMPTLNDNPIKIKFNMFLALLYYRPNRAFKCDLGDKKQTKATHAIVKAFQNTKEQPLRLLNHYKYLFYTLLQALIRLTHHTIPNPIIFNISCGFTFQTTVHTNWHSGFFNVLVVGNLNQYLLIWYRTISITVNRNSYSCN